MFTAYHCYPLAYTPAQHVKYNDIKLDIIILSSLFWPSMTKQTNWHIRRRSDYIIGFIAPAIGPNKSKKLSRFIAPVHNIRGKVWMIKTYMASQTDSYRLWSHVCRCYHSNFAAFIVFWRYKPCEFLWFLWTDCWGNKSYYVITSPANWLFRDNCQLLCNASIILYIKWTFGVDIFTVWNYKLDWNPLHAGIDSCTSKLLSVCQTFRKLYLNIPKSLQKYCQSFNFFRPRESLPEEKWAITTLRVIIL